MTQNSRTGIHTEKLTSKDPFPVYARDLKSGTLLELSTDLLEVEQPHLEESQYPKMLSQKVMMMIGMKKRKAYWIIPPVATIGQIQRVRLKYQLKYFCSCVIFSEQNFIDLRLNYVKKIYFLFHSIRNW